MLEPLAPAVWRFKETAGFTMGNHKQSVNRYSKTRRELHPRCEQCGPKQVAVLPHLQCSPLTRTAGAARMVTARAEGLAQPQRAGKPQQMAYSRCGSSLRLQQVPSTHASLSLGCTQGRAAQRNQPAAAARTPQASAPQSWCLRPQREYRGVTGGAYAAPAGTQQIGGVRWVPASASRKRRHQGRACSLGGGRARPKGELGGGGCICTWHRGSMCTPRVRRWVQLALMR